MARIALIDPSGRIATTVEAILGRAHEIIVRPRVHAPGDAELVIADLRPSELADQSTIRSLVSFGPVLLLVDKVQPIPPGIDERPDLSVLRKPFDAFELRLKVDRLVQAVAAPARQAPWREEDDRVWLEFPYVPVTAGAVLRRAARMEAPLWIMGEAGCGRRRIAMAVARVALPAMRVVTVFPDERLGAVLEREGGERPFALLVPEIDQRPLLEQERLAAIAAGPRGFRLIATSVDDPAEAVLEGSFSRNLYQHLIGLAVQISPLRERTLAIPPLVQALTHRIARGLGIDGDLSFSPDAMARLQTYMWPGNLVELESVLNRTLAFLGDSELGGRTVEADELMFTPVDSSRPRPASPVVAPLGDITRRDDSRDEQGHSPAANEAPPQRALEQVMAGLAHDLRNPMVTIKTFAGAISGGSAADESTRELGSLASDACDRIDGYLEALQDYSDFGDPRPRRLDALGVLRSAIQELPPEVGGRFEVEAEGSREITCDAEQFRFVIDNLVEASLGEIGPDQRVRVHLSSRDAITFEIPTGRGPVTKLRLLVGGDEETASWRILLARAVAERNGCGVEVDDAGSTRTIRCVLPRGEATRGEQTGRINR